MSNFFLAIQIICYGVGIVSASLNILGFVRRWQASSPSFDELD